jgi:glycosyltransferase involved in cell wall biosynthesis
MKNLTLCINSQTPLVRFKHQYTELVEKYGDLPDPVPLGMLMEGEDYELSPGGVPKVVYPLVTRMMEAQIVRNSHWVCLNPIGPFRVKAGKITIHNISLEASDLPSYAHMKERIWEEVHDIERHPVGPKEFYAYARYNWFCAKKMFELSPVDIFYVHDFQQLQVGNMIGLAAPAVFRWHIPLTFERVDPYMRRFIIKCMEAYDAVIVSCRRDLQGLISAGYHGKAYQLYPYVDERKWTRPSDQELSDFCLTYTIREDDELVLVVGRMDRIKGQDVVIRAMTKVVRKFPNAKLMLIGDGSFSGAARGGLSHPKANVWRARLEELTRKLKLEEHVIFTGYLSDERLKCAYQRADVVVLPSVREGFGLVVPEAWLYKKPVVVSRGAGASETVMEGVNGFAFSPKDFGELAGKLLKLLKKPKLASTMGRRGKETARNLSISRGVRDIAEVFGEVIKSFGSRA